MGTTTATTWTRRRGLLKGENLKSGRYQSIYSCKIGTYPFKDVDGFEHEIFSTA